MAQCSYISEIGAIQCEEQALPSSKEGLCIFHEKLDAKNIDECMQKFYEKLLANATNFEGYILKDVDFSLVDITHIGEIDSSLWFNNAQFHGAFSAEGVKFLGYVSFQHSTFHQHVNFSNAQFTGGAIFDYVTFHDRVDFFLSEFFREARFSNSVVEKFCSFRNVTFRGPAFFNRAHFRESVDFTDALFDRGGNFNHASMAFISFENAVLENVSFDDVVLSNARFHGARLHNTHLSGANWEGPWRSIWRRVILREEIEALRARRKCSSCQLPLLDEKTTCERCGRFFIDSSRSFSCPQCQIKQKKEAAVCENEQCAAQFASVVDNEIFIDKSQRSVLFKSAEDIYRNIKLNLQDDGDYQTAGEFYFNEMLMRRKRGFRDRRYLDWFVSQVNSKICGYGERANRIIIASILIVVFLAFWYYLFDGVVREGVINTPVSFLESLYFSFVTFTTLGYGDYAPRTAFQLIAVTEAFVGAFMIALFVLVFGRKMLR